MRSILLQLIFAAFLITGCVGGSGTGGTLSGMDGGPSGGGPGGGQAQPTNQGVSEVEPGTPVDECELVDCPEFKAPGDDPDPPEPPHGPTDMTI